jgi:tRNA (guanine37-N1)-methyltransferase
LTQSNIKKLSKKQSLIILCGRYKGIDERIIKHYVDEEISIGNYILNGGEAAAVILVETITRILPSVDYNHQSKESDSFSSNLLDCPYYTSPMKLNSDLNVPNILLSGNHKRIEKWKKEQKLLQTLKKRKELINYDSLDKENIYSLKK